MNRLSTERRAQVIGCLVEGMSIRGTVRVTGVAKNTVTKLLIDVGSACARYQDELFRNLDIQRVECDEIWSFCYAKQKNVPEQFRGTPGYGDVWTWVAIDADTKLIPSWLVGERTHEDAYVFLKDLRTRTKGRVQISTDGLEAYLNLIEPIFGSDRVDYTRLVKAYGPPKNGDESHGYSKQECIGSRKVVVAGMPNLDLAGTSYVESQNLTIRMGMRRFTRMSSGFSKKVENMAHAVSLHFAYYNLARPHKTLKGDTPAMEAGLARYKWSISQLVDLAN